MRAYNRKVVGRMRTVCTGFDTLEHVNSDVDLLLHMSASAGVDLAKVA